MRVLVDASRDSTQVAMCIENNSLVTQEVGNESGQEIVWLREGRVVRRMTCSSGGGGEGADDAVLETHVSGAWQV